MRVAGGAKVLKHVEQQSQVFVRRSILSKRHPAENRSNPVPDTLFPILVMTLDHSTDLDSSVHVPVLARQVVDLMKPHAGQVILDGTLGGGGHTRLLLPHLLPGGQVIALDADPDAVERAKAEFANDPVTVIQANYRDAEQVLEQLGIPHVDAALLDLGLSSDQLADDQRGFSFQRDSALDMRFDPQRGQPAWRLLADLSERELADLIYRFGEERFSRRIARAIVTERRTRPIKTTSQLADIVRRSARYRGRWRIDPATRTFQALRIAVNDELASLEQFLAVLPRILADGGRGAIISFHSLEDRLVKSAFRESLEFEMITRKPVRPSDDEVRQNSRARSARLRVVARISRRDIEPSSQRGNPKR